MFVKKDENERKRGKGWPNFNKQNRNFRKINDSRKRAFLIYFRPQFVIRCDHISRRLR